MGSDRDHLEGYSAALRWLEAIQTAAATFEAAAAIAQEADRDIGLALLANALIEFALAFGYANEQAGRRYSRRDVRRLILRSWPNRPVGKAELRAIATRIAYSDGVRLSSAGSNDTPIEAAYQAAFVLIDGLSLHLDEEPNSALCDSIADAPNHTESIRKSNYRLRTSVRGTSLFSLDRESLRVELWDAELALFQGLPGKRGRPRKPA